MEESKSTFAMKVGTYLNNVKEYLSNPTLAIVSEPKPWVSEFLSVAKFSKPHKEDIFNRAKDNLIYYLPNYLIVYIVFLVLGV
jgi:hypothetical protein